MKAGGADAYADAVDAVEAARVLEAAVRDRLDDLERSKEILEQYAEQRARIKDRHGVMDAMADLREVEVAIEVLRWVLDSNTVFPC